MQHVHSSPPFDNSCSHMFHILMTSFLHEPFWYDFTLFKGIALKSAMVNNVTFEWLLPFMSRCNIHELILCVLWPLIVLQNLLGICHIWIFSFLHELIQYVYPDYLCMNMCNHKFYIWMAFYPHELNFYDQLKYSFL